MKKLLGILLILFTLLSVCAFASPARVVDDEHLLNSEEAEALTARLDEIREQYQFDLIIHTTSSFGGKSSEAYADDYFDYNGYGVGEHWDGAILVVSLEEGEIYISSCGVGESMFNRYTVDEIFDTFIDDIRAGEYARGFDTFISVSKRFLDRKEEYMEKYRGGWEDDVSTFSWFSPIRLIIAIVIGLIARAIGLSTLKGQLKSVRSKAEANSYVVPNSMNLTGSNDLFLYSSVSKVRIDNDTSRSSGSHSSGSHHSSSGHSHSGGGRKL